MMSHFSVEKIKLKNVNAYFDCSINTEIKETETMLYYKTQTFYCEVEIEIPQCVATHDWTIGLVQACDHMYLENNYDGLGSSLWEFHPLKSGLRKMINDSDGKQYPFYSASHSLHNIKKGTVRKTSLHLQIKDYFHPSVVWELPYSGGVWLTDINRKQKFLIWVVAVKHGKRCSSASEVSVLKKLRWEYKLYMKIDPFMPLGERVKTVSDCQDENIITMEPERSYKLPSAATKPPHCNAAQSLIWYPKETHKHNRILVPPKQIIVPWDKWVSDMLGSKVRIRKPSEVIEMNINQV